MQADDEERRAGSIHRNEPCLQSSQPSRRNDRRRNAKNRQWQDVNAQSQEIDGFQLVIDALKLNGIDTIFGLPGIPITDLTRKLQAAGTARDLLPP